MDTPYELSAEEEALYNMSDDELEAAFKSAKQSQSTEQSEDYNDGADDSEEETETEDTEVDLEDSNEQTTNEEDTTEESEDSSEKDSEETEENTEVTSTVPKKHKIKANGVEFEFTDEELLMLAPKAMDYTKKMQEIAPWRRAISAMADNGLTEDDINLLIDAKKGNKDAMTAFLRQTGIDALELDMEQADSYVPNRYGKDESQLAIEDVVNAISKDQEFTITQDVVDRQWDRKSTDILRQNPSYIHGLHNDIKDGTYYKVLPEAMKLKALDGGSKSDVEYYIEAGSRMFNQLTPNVQQPVMQEDTARQTRQANIKEASNKRKAAALPKSNAGTKTVVDYLDDNDEDFDKWYSQLQARM